MEEGEYLQVLAAQEVHWLFYVRLYYQYSLSYAFLQIKRQGPILPKEAYAFLPNLDNTFLSNSKDDLRVAFLACLTF